MFVHQNQEYDIPEYKYLVDHLIAEELQHSSIDDVDLNRRFPKLWSDAELDACVKRIEQVVFPVMPAKFSQ